MTKDQKIIRAKARLLELAKQLGNVSQACKVIRGRLRYTRISTTLTDVTHSRRRDTPERTSPATSGALRRSPSAAASSSTSPPSFKIKRSKAELDQTHKAPFSLRIRPCARTAGSRQRSAWRGCPASRRSLGSTSHSSRRSTAIGSWRWPLSTSSPVPKLSTCSDHPVPAKATSPLLLPSRRCVPASLSTSSHSQISSLNSLRPKAKGRCANAFASSAEPHCLSSTRSATCQSLPAAATCSSNWSTPGYEKGAVILNRGFAEWGDIFGSPVVATALLDRLLHHAIVIQIEGSSYRHARACRSPPREHPCQYSRQLGNTKTPRPPSHKTINRSPTCLTLNATPFARSGNFLRPLLRKLRAL